MKRDGYLMGIGIIGCLCFCGCMPQAIQDKIISNAREDLQNSNHKIEAQQRIMLSSLQQESLKKIQSMTADIAQKNKAAVSTFTADSQKMQKEAMTSIQNQNQVMKNLADESSQKIKQMTEEIKSGNSKALSQVVKDFRLLVQAKVAGNEKAAAEAFEQAKNCIDNENFALARMYCLNAINHLPSNYSYYKKLVEIQQAIQNSKAEDWEQVRNIVELGLFQIDSKYISELLKIQENIIQKIQTIETQTAEEDKNRTQQTVNQTLQEVQNFNIKEENFVHNNTDHLLSYIEKLNQLSNNTDYLTQEKRSWVQEQITAALEVSNYVALLKKIKIYLDKADELLLHENQAELPAVSSMVQSANQLITQGWSLDKTTSFPQYYSMLKTDAKRVADLEQKFNKVKSVPAMSKINALSADNFISSDDTSRGELTKKIDATQKYIGEIAKLSAEVYDRENQYEIQGILKKSNLQIQEYSKERYKKYQEWALEQCRSAFAKYNSWKRVDEDDAMSVIDDFMLEIDATLLTPPLATLYQDVLQKQLAEMGVAKKIEYQAKLAESSKKTLEDF